MHFSTALFLVIPKMGKTGIIWTRKKLHIFSVSKWTLPIFTPCLPSQPPQRTFIVLAETTLWGQARAHTRTYNDSPLFPSVLWADILSSHPLASIRLIYHLPLEINTSEINHCVVSIHLFLLLLLLPRFFYLFYWKLKQAGANPTRAIPWVLRWSPLCNCLFSLVSLTSQITFSFPCNTDLGAASSSAYAFTLLLWRWLEL